MYHSMIHLYEKACCSARIDQQRDCELKQPSPSRDSNLPSLYRLSHRCMVRGKVKSLNEDEDG